MNNKEKDNEKEIKKAKKAKIPKNPDQEKKEST